jgi:hypothetical protein
MKTNKTNGSYAIHDIHLKFQDLSLNRSSVECNICHAMPQGYNSNHVSVPAWSGLTNRYSETIYKPPWNQSCAYCHSIASGGRLHDVHKPVLQNACPVCHSPLIFQLTKSTYLNNPATTPTSVDIEEPQTIIETIEETISAPSSPLGTELYLYYNRVYDTILKSIDMMLATLFSTDSK